MDDFSKAAQPLIDYLKTNHHPYMIVIVTGEKAELLEGQLNYFPEINTIDRFGDTLK